MFTKPSFGWTNLKLSNDFSFPASYLTDIPNDFIKALTIALKNNVDLVFSGHWHSGGKYDFGNFTEFCFKSFCENRDNESQWTFVTLDESAQNVRFDNYLVTNGKLDVNTVNYRF